jgi:hypothetical protein
LFWGLFPSGKPSTWVSQSNSDGWERANYQSHAGVHFERWLPTCQSRARHAARPRAPPPPPSSVRTPSAPWPRTTRCRLTSTPKTGPRCTTKHRAGRAQGHMPRCGPSHGRSPRRLTSRVSSERCSPASTPTAR